MSPVFYAALLWIGLLLAVSGCQGSPSPAPAIQETQEAPSAPVAVVSDPVESPVELTDDLAQEHWQSSPHAQTFVMGQSGANSDCARCHAPVEFVPSMDDLPESCFTCKFTVDPPPPVIPEDKWSHVNCQVCHEVNKKGVRSPGIAWLEIAAIGEYSKLETSTELCTKCHTEVAVAGHAPVELGGAHEGMLCTQCHDSHTTVASCGSSGCHEDVSSSDVPGHDEAHQHIPCAVCHDNNGWELSLAETGVWATLLTVEAGGETVVRPRTSHNLGREVQCSTCHFPGNAWGLAEAVE